MTEVGQNFRLASIGSLDFLLGFMKWYIEDEQVGPSWAASSNSFGALELAEFMAPCSRVGSMGHWPSTKWLKMSHDHPFWMRSQHGSSLRTSMGGCSSGRQPWLMALRKAVVWLVDKLRKPQHGHEQMEAMEAWNAS